MSGAKYLMFVIIYLSGLIIKVYRYCQVSETYENVIYKGSLIDPALEILRVFELRKISYTSSFIHSKYAFGD